MRPREIEDERTNEGRVRKNCCRKRRRRETEEEGKSWRTKGIVERRIAALYIFCRRVVA